MLVSDFAPDKRLLSPSPLLLRNILQERASGGNEERAPVKTSRSWGGGPSSQRPLTNNYRRPVTVYQQGAFNYARHKPHPRRVFHFKGLLDLPICHVEDVDSLKPNVIRPATASSPNILPNVNSQMWPLNTLNGLALLQNLSSIKEISVPTRGLIPLKENWRDELRALTEAVLLPSGTEKKPATADTRSKVPDHHPYPICRPITAVIEKAARMPNLEASTAREPWPGSDNYDTVAAVVFAPHRASELLPWESQVFTLLAQMLQASTPDAVKQWLNKATDREKIHALDQLSKALNKGKQPAAEDNSQEVEDFPLPRPKTSLLVPEFSLDRPSTSLGHSSWGNFDRLIVHDSPASLVEKEEEEKTPNQDSRSPFSEESTAVESTQSWRTRDADKIMPDRPKLQRSWKCCPHCHADLVEKQSSCHNPLSSMGGGGASARKKITPTFNYVNILTNPNLVRTTMNF